MSSDTSAAAAGSNKMISDMEKAMLVLVTSEKVKMEAEKEFARQAAEKEEQMAKQHAEEMAEKAEEMAALEEKFKAE